jgi:hypothetical protein
MIVKSPIVLISFSLLWAAGAAWAQQPPPADEPADEPEAKPDAQQAESMADMRRRIEELERKLESVSGKLEQSELEKIVQEAEAESKAPEEEEKPEDRNFLWGALALQKLNPELSFCADFLAGVILDGDGKFYAGADDRSGMPVREVGLNFQHVLDPYSLFKSAINFIPHEGVQLEEVYISWFGFIRSLSFTLGRFRQNFGVLNRWHEHDLDQTGYPLAMDLVLGEDGLVGNGISVKWFLPPLWAHALELTIEITDGENEALFAGEAFSVPTVMMHLKNYYDLTDATYLELGLTGMFGFNNRRGYVEANKLRDEDWRRTAVAGADLTLYWSPPQRAKYRSLTWRTEAYYAGKEVPDIVAGTGRDKMSHSWGLYSYLMYQLSTRWFCGARFDVALPTEREADTYAWDAVPFITFWQSEFVYLRLEYRHGQEIPYLTPEDTLARRTDNRVLLQVDFAAGPHKHEKY